jgi:hypothetical protein
MRQGYTLVEVIIAAALGSLLLGSLMAMLVSGSRLFSKGVGAARGPEAALIIMDELEQDLLQCLQFPGDPRPPVAISSDKKEIAFYRTRPMLEGDLEVVGDPIIWSLVPGSGKGSFFPRRNGKVFRTLGVNDWEFELLPPDVAERRSGWFVVVRVRFTKDSQVSREYLSSRLIFLKQPSSNFLYFPKYGPALLPGAVKLARPKENNALFSRLGPPAGGPSLSDQAPSSTEPANE